MTTLTSSIRHLEARRDIIRAELADGQGKRGTAWYDDRVREIHAITRSIQAREDAALLADDTFPTEDTVELAPTSTGWDVVETGGGDDDYDLMFGTEDRSDTLVFAWGRCAMTIVRHRGEDFASFAYRACHAFGWTSTVKFADVNGAVRAVSFDRGGLVWL